MRRSRLFIGAAAFVAASLIASGASAQDTTVSAGAVVPEYSVASFVGALDASPATIEKLGAASSIKAENITLVDVNTFAANDTAKAVDAAIEKHAEHIIGLRAKLADQPAVAEVLAKHTPAVSIDDVVGVEVQAEDKLVIYYRGKEGQ